MSDEGASPLTKVELPYPGGTPKSVVCPQCEKRTKNTRPTCWYCGQEIEIATRLTKPVLDKRSPEEIAASARAETRWVRAICVGACLLVASLYELYGSGREHDTVRTFFADNAERTALLSRTIRQSVR